MGRNTHRDEMHRLTPVKRSVRCATTGSGTLATSFENGDTIDGVTLATGDRILIKDQGNADNGIYIVAASGAPTRSYDMDTGEEVRGVLVYVREGTANGGKVFRNTNTSAVTLGVTTPTFAEVAATASITYATTSDLADVAATESAGAATTVPRGDHVHALGIGTTKGDILVRDGSTWVRLPVGTDGDVLTADSGETSGVLWTPAGTGSLALDDLSDVNAPTPTDQDVLTWDDGASEWIAQAPPGGGSLTQAYVGYNTVGGSWETMTNWRVFAKKVTLANDCLLTNIEAYLRDRNGVTETVSGAGFGLYTDNSGTPGVLISQGSPGVGQQANLLDSVANTATGAEVGRWYGQAFGMWLTAGDYWIAYQNMNSAATIRQIAYDGSGSDRYYTSGGQWMVDWGWYTPTTSSNKYSIRANTVR